MTKNFRNLYIILYIILFSISVTALVIACLAFANGRVNGEYFESDSGYTNFNGVTVYKKYADFSEEQSKLSPNKWTFKSDSRYTCVLEHVGQEHGEQYLQIIKKKYRKKYNENKKYLIKLCHKNDLYGKTNKYNFNSFTTCSPTNLRYILFSFMIFDYIKQLNLNNIDFIEIGGGYGGLCFFIFKLSKLFKVKIKSYTIFDLYEASSLQKKYLDALEIKNVNFYQLDNFKNLKKGSFLISTYAFSEISKNLQEEYSQKIINPYTDYGFLAWNLIPVYDFVKNSKIEKEVEYPMTGAGAFYVKFSLNK